MTNKEALKQKQQQFDELVKDVSNCRICRHLYFPLGCPDGEYLDHSDHPGYLNAWNLQACDLMASCMILGQDFGVLLDDETLQKGGFPERIIRQATKNRQFLSTTDKNVRSLLHLPDPQKAPDAPLKDYFFYEHRLLLPPKRKHDGIQPLLVFDLCIPFSGQADPDHPAKGHYRIGQRGIQRAQLLPERFCCFSG